MSLALPSTERIANCRILVVGDVMLDRYWHGNVGRISPEAPVPIVHIRQEENRLGGAANVALNARNLGAKVTVLSTVGKDDAAHTLRNLLDAYGIDADLREDPDMETIVKLRVISRSQQMLRMDFEKRPGHEALVSMLDRFGALLDQHDVVLFSDYGKGGLVHISQMTRMAISVGKAVLIDPKGRDWARYSSASVITPNLAELTEVIGEWSCEAELHSKTEALRRELNVKALLVTRSEEGMTLFDSNGATSIKARAHEVADVTGAGDTVIAIIATMVACGLDLPQAVSLANRGAGLVVAKFGTASLTWEELRG